MMELKLNFALKFFLKIVSVYLKKNLLIILVNNTQQKFFFKKIIKSNTHL